MKELVETLTKLVGVFSVGALTLSVFHEVGFFSVIGDEFRHLFSISDYFASVIAWLPQSAFYTFAIAIFMPFSNIAKWNFIYRYPDKGLPRTFGDRLTDLLLYFTLFTAIVGLFFGPPWLYVQSYPVLIGGVFFIWAKLVNLSMRKMAFMDAVPKPALLVLVVAPALVVMSFLSGVNEAYSSFFGLPDVYTIEQNSTQNHVIFLRSFDKGVLVRDPVKETFELVKWDRIDKITTRGIPRTQTLFCKVTGYLCPRRSPEP